MDEKKWVISEDYKKASDRERDEDSEVKMGGY